MKSFTAFLDRAEQEAVAEYILESFVRKKAVKPGYHTAENGWPDHERKYGAAFPFVLGEIGIDRPVETLSAAERTGRDLFISACVTCHEPRSSAPLRIEPFPLSHMGRVVREAPVDAISSASVYAKHDVPPVIPDLTPAQARGQRLFEDNCAFCHGADGTGRNWIGSFLEPHPRDLTDPAQTAHLDRMALRRVIREGLPDTSMPAWRHVLTAAEIADIAAYVERAFLRPATGN